MQGEGGADEEEEEVEEVNWKSDHDLKWSSLLFFLPCDQTSHFLALFIMFKW